MRSAVSYKLTRVVRNPRAAWFKLRRSFRNAAIRGDHITFYRRVMALDARVDPGLAIGSHDTEHWDEVGRLQFDYLVKHGLEPHHRVLDIGCGNLRGGWRIIDLLEPDHYFGVDISPEILIAAQSTLERFGLQDKTPHLTLVDGMHFSFLPDGHFDIIHAHSVFTHSPRDVIESCLGEIARLLSPTGFFDFTFFSADGKAVRPYQVNREHFYYPNQLKIGRAHV